MLLGEQEPLYLGACCCVRLKSTGIFCPLEAQSSCQRRQLSLEPDSLNVCSATGRIYCRGLWRRTNPPFFCTTSDTLHICLRPFGPSLRVLNLFSVSSLALSRVWHGLAWRHDVCWSSVLLRWLHQPHFTSLWREVKYSDAGIVIFLIV